MWPQPLPERASLKDLISPLPMDRWTWLPENPAHRAVIMQEYTKAAGADEDGSVNVSYQTTTRSMMAGQTLTQADLARVPPQLSQMGVRAL